MMCGLQQVVCFWCVGETQLFHIMDKTEGRGKQMSPVWTLFLWARRRCTYQAIQLQWACKIHAKIETSFWAAMLYMRMDWTLTVRRGLGVLIAITFFVASSCRWRPWAMNPMCWWKPSQPSRSPARGHIVEKKPTALWLRAREKVLASEWIFWLHKWRAGFDVTVTRNLAEKWWHSLKIFVGSRPQGYIGDHHFLLKMQANDVFNDTSAFSWASMIWN